MSREMTGWQKAVYGDRPAARAALEFYRKRGWPVDVDTPLDRERCAVRMRSFINGYEVAPKEGQQIGAKP